MLCKNTRENLRTAVIARDKEVLKQRQMLDLKAKFTGNNVSPRIIFNLYQLIPHSHPNFLGSSRFGVVESQGRS